MLGDQENRETGPEPRAGMNFQGPPAVANFCQLSLTYSRFQSSKRAPKLGTNIQNTGSIINATVVMKHHIQNNLGKKGFIWVIQPHRYSSPKEVRTEAQTSRNLEVGVDAEAMKWCCFLAYSTYFLIEPRPPAQEWKPLLIGWALPHQ